MNNKSNNWWASSNLGSWFKLWCKIILPTHAQAKLVVIESEALRGGETVNKSWIITACHTSQIRSVPFLPYFLCEDLRKMLLLAVFLINHLLLMQHVVEGHVVDLIVHHHRTPRTDLYIPSITIAVFRRHAIDAYRPWRHGRKTHWRYLV